MGKGGRNVATASVAEALAKQWWVLLVRGILALLFGIVAVALPSLTLLALVMLFGVYVLLDGMVVLWVGVGARAWWLVIVGILGLIAGILAFVYPSITAVALLCLIAAWAIVRGMFEIIAAIQLRKGISNQWMLIIGGIVSIIFGVVLVARPSVGALAMVWVIGVFALVFGVAMIVLSFQLRALPERLKKVPGET